MIVLLITMKGIQLPTPFPVISLVYFPSALITSCPILIRIAAQIPRLLSLLSKILLLTWP